MLVCFSFVYFTQQYANMNKQHIIELSVSQKARNVDKNIAAWGKVENAYETAAKSLFTN